MSQIMYSFTGGLLAGGIIYAIATKAIGKRRRKKFLLDRAVLPEAIHHLVYEYSNLIHSAEHVAYESKGGPIDVHIADVFLLNCRKFGDFFSTRSNYHADVRR